MPGDYTQATFQPFRDFRGVHMQQGRVMLDADFNELADILDRRFRAETTDIIGRCVVPRETIDGFRIQISGGTITIGRGRLYADGLLAENHGLPPLEFDRILAEQRGTQPVPYDQQPYLPDAANLDPLPIDLGTMLVYVDVWEREVTHLENPNLVEKAVGVDTATRRQVVWQVKALGRVGDITCSTPAEQIPGWLDIIRPSDGHLTTSTAGVPADTDPCVVNPTGGFRGTENRLYRVEVHDPGPLGTATFKWSRDNASIGALVVGVNAGRDILTLSSLGRDAVTRIQVNDWIEVIDDDLELRGKPGEMRKVQFVDEVNRTLTLVAALTAGLFDTADPGSRHTRIRRWDQEGLVFDAANNVVGDVDASNGVIPIPSAGGMILEDGVQVEFSVAAAGGSLHTGDYWLIAARTVDASIDILSEAPPKGIHHHFCRLAVVTFPDIVIDCRTLWPPDFGGEGCDCTECVTAESHNSGAFTIQMAIDRVRAEGGKVCLQNGLYNLGTTPLLMNGLSSVQLEGHGWRTILVYTGIGAAIVVSGSTGVDLSKMTVIALARELPSFAVIALNSTLVNIERCLLAQLLGTQQVAAAVGVSGFLIETRISENIIFGNSGLVSITSVGGNAGGLATQRQVAFLVNFRCEQNFVIGRQRGIALEGLTLHLAETRIAENILVSSRASGISARGFVGSTVLSSSRLDIVGNSIQTTGDGVVVAVDNARVSDNDIGVIFQRDPQGTGSGIVIEQAVGGGIDRLQVLANRVVGVAGDGIRIAGEVTSGAIKNNVIDAARGSGIVMDERASAEQLVIENNQIVRSGLRNDGQTALAAIRAVRVNQLEISSNSIDQFARIAVQNPARLGIEVFACRSVRICGNDLVNLAPGQFVKLGGGIQVRAPFDRVDVVDNSVRRSGTPADPASSGWIAVSIAQPVPQRLGEDLSGLLFPFIVAIGDSFFGLGLNTLVELPAGKEMVAVRGNLLETFGPLPAVDIQTGTACVIGDNRCLLEAPRDVSTPVVDATCRAAVVNANFLRRTPASDNFSALNLNVGDGPFTVVGNVFNGRAVVNGIGLQQPWAPINAFVFG